MEVGSNGYFVTSLIKKNTSEGTKGVKCSVNHKNFVNEALVTNIQKETVNSYVRCFCR